MTLKKRPSVLLGTYKESQSKISYGFDLTYQTSHTNEKTDIGTVCMALYEELYLQ